MTDSVTLREYVEMRLNAMEAAVVKAENAAEKRFEAINEMRSMVTDAALQYMPRKEFETAFGSLSEKVEFINKIIMPRGEYDIEHKALASKVEMIDKLYLPRSENEATRQTLVQKNDDEHARLFGKQEAMNRFIWIGVGIVITVQFLIGALLIIWKKA